MRLGGAGGSMKIQKTEKSTEGKLGTLRAKIPGQPEIQIDDRGKLAVQVTAWVPDGKGNSDQHKVVLTDGDIERLRPEESRGGKESVSTCRSWWAQCR